MENDALQRVWSDWEAVPSREFLPSSSHGVPDEFGVAIRKGDNELRKLLEEGYAKLAADPYWQELQKKYLKK